MAHKPRDSRSVPTGRLRRLGRWVKMAPEAGLALLRPGGGDRLGEIVSDTLGKLKGGSMKVGQILAQVADDLPPALRLQLGALYGDVPSLPPEQVREVLTAEIGGVQRFATFEEAPFAAASLGQVHRATLPDGTAVAVKVQYPGVDQALRDDLDLLGRTQHTLTGGGLLFDASGYFAALRDLTLGELDYHAEAAHRDRLAAAVAAWPDLVVPRVHADFSADKVLTLDRLEGPMLHDWAAQAHPPEERDRLGAQLVNAVYGPLAAADLANADAHPGNFIVLPHGRLGLLDFGAVSALERDHVDAFFVLARTLRDRGPASRLIADLRAAGFLVALSDERAEVLAQALADAIGPSVRGVHDFAADPPMARFTKFKLDYPLESVGIRPTPPILPMLRASLGLAHGLRRLRARVDLGAAVADLEAMRNATPARPSPGG